MQLLSSSVTCFKCSMCSENENVLVCIEEKKNFFQVQLHEAKLTSTCSMKYIFSETTVDIVGSHH
jgi:hypothetical protein